jgi:hypothetical protein
MLDSRRELWCFSAMSPSAKGGGTPQETYGVYNIINNTDAGYFFIDTGHY